jgi:hypothetical protein
VKSPIGSLSTAAADASEAVLRLEDLEAKAEAIEIITVYLRR